MTITRLNLFLSLALCSLSGAVHGGVIRYDLPELVGEHRYDGSAPVLFGRVAHVDTPFGFYSVAQARLVVEGSVSAGKARGDGILRPPIDFELEPSVGAVPSFARAISFSTESVEGSFRIDDGYANPFQPEVVPLPNLDGYPPISFYVWFRAGLSFASDVPPLITPAKPGELVLWTDGTIVDVPIIANVTEAYILLEGPGVAPEPLTSSLAAIAVLIASAMSRRLTSLWPF